MENIFIGVIVPLMKVLFIELLPNLLFKNNIQFVLKSNLKLDFKNKMNLDFDFYMDFNSK